MEQYTADISDTTYSSPCIRQGKYFEKVHAKHKDAYGESGAINIRDNITSTFGEALRQLGNQSLNNNMLLVGKVQSGKTSNLELFTALAFDNGFNFVIIYGGYDNTLLAQTTGRFKKTFDIPNDTKFEDDTPVVFSSDDSAQLLSVDNDIVEDLMEAQKPIFIISMKRPAAMNKVNDLLARIDKSNLRAFIIDDEGDQASLNTKKNKAADASATYAAIVAMKEHLDDPLYLSVTATPHALIFLDEYSRLRPDSIRLIEPGKGYCGVEAYHLYDSGAIEIISEEDQQTLTEGLMPDSLMNALRHYLISSAIMYKRGRMTSEMIIHAHRNVTQHHAIYRMVNSWLDSLKDSVEAGDPEDLRVLYDEFLTDYQTLFPDQVRTNLSFDELWTIIRTKILKRTYLILKNSTGQVTQANESLRKYKIYIGGDLLQRGVTFSNLVTTYFSRWAKDGGNMDTNLQRARWFGYREKWIDICKIFTSESIAREFTNLSEMETDLWEQFTSVQAGEMSIDDILIKADNTKQKPTRKNVATYTAVSFRNKWIKQRVGVFDRKQVTHNNSEVEEFLSTLHFSDLTAGRRDGLVSAQTASVDRTVLTKLIDHMEAVFDLEPFEKRPLKDLIESSGCVHIVLMKDNDGAGRQRSFYSNNKIYALQQGADNKDKEKAVFLGDSFVIANPNEINIQIHRIVPKKKVDGVTVVLSEFTQYMFAVYIPKEKVYFIKG